MFKTLFPQKYGYSAFYIAVSPNLKFRIYKTEYIFSAVGEAYIFTLYVSFRHLNKIKQFKYADKRTICFECDVNTGNRILNDLKQTGYADISRVLGSGR